MSRKELDNPPFDKCKKEMGDRTNTNTITGVTDNQLTQCFGHGNKMKSAIINA